MQFREEAAAPRIERSPRHEELVTRLLSDAVQELEPEAAQEESAKLSEQEVSHVFTSHVPGAAHLLYREQENQFALNFAT